MGFLNDVQKILTYDNSTMDIILNYILFVISFFLVCWLNYWVVQNLSRGPVSTHQYIRFPAVYVIGMFIFQISLCLFADCVGISVVWSSNVGVIWMLVRLINGQRQWRNYSSYDQLIGASSTVTVIVACIAVWCYYAIIEEALTTVAHLCALILGIIIGNIYVKFISVNQSRSSGDVEFDESLDDSFIPRS
jgi:hypothetical protein